MNRILALFLALVVSGAALAQPVSSTRPGFDTQAIGIDQNLGAQLPLELEFTDEDGKSVKLGDYFNKGQAVILNPVWYGCAGTCEMALEGLIGAFTSFKVDGPAESFQVVTFSIKPSETPADARKRKNEVYGIYNRPETQTGWHFLTGNQESITALTEALGFRYTVNPKDGKINHAAGIMVATPDGKVSQYLYGVEYPGKLLLRYLENATDKKVGVKTEPRLLGCFDFDPTTNTTRLNVWRTIQVAGVLTVIIAAVSITVMSLRHRTPSVPISGDKNNN